MYIRKILSISAVLILSVNSINAQNNIMEKYGDLLMHYFENKSDLIIEETINVYNTLDYTENIDNTVIIFFCGIKSNDPDKYKHFYNQVINCENERLKEIFDFINNFDLDNFLNGQEPSPGFNDFLWTLYFSSGNTNYLDILFNIVNTYSEDGNINNYVSARSAIWSIRLNMFSYPSIMQYFIDTQIIDNKKKEYIFTNDAETINNDTMQYIENQREKGIW